MLGASPLYLACIRGYNHTPEENKRAEVIKLLLEQKKNFKGFLLFLSFY